MLHFACLVVVTHCPEPILLSLRKFDPTPGHHHQSRPNRLTQSAVKPRLNARLIQQVLLIWKGYIYRISLGKHSPLSLTSCMQIFFPFSALSSNQTPSQCWGYYSGNIWILSFEMEYTLILGWSVAQPCDVLTIWVSAMRAEAMDAAVCLAWLPVLLWPTQSRLHPRLPLWSELRAPEFNPGQPSWHQLNPSQLTDTW